VLMPPLTQPRRGLTWAIRFLSTWTARRQTEQLQLWLISLATSQEFCVRGQ